MRLFATCSVALSSSALALAAATLAACGGPYVGQDGFSSARIDDDVNSVGPLGVGRNMIVDGDIGPLAVDRTSPAMADDAGGMLALTVAGDGADGALFLMPTSGEVADLLEILH